MGHRVSEGREGGREGGWVRLYFAYCCLYHYYCILTGVTGPCMDYKHPCDLGNL